MTHGHGGEQGLTLLKFKRLLTGHTTCVEEWQQQRRHRQQQTDEEQRRVMDRFVGVLTALDWLDLSNFFSPRPSQSAGGYSAVGAHGQADTVIFDEGTVKTRKGLEDDADHSQLDVYVTYVLTAISWLIVLISFPASLIFCLKIAREYERAVIFRLGSLVSGDAKGPGLFFILPCIDKFRLIDLRTQSYDVPPQEVLSKDSVTVTVDAVIYFQTNDPIQSVTNVNDAIYSTKLIAQSTLRNVLGTKTLAEMLSDREGIAYMAMKMLDDATERWGVKVERVEMKDVKLPSNLTRAMAAEAEATRNARAQCIATEGERQASSALQSASEILDTQTALKLRQMQTMVSIAQDSVQSTILFPIPMECVLPFTKFRPKKRHRKKVRRSPSPPATFAPQSREMYELNYESVMPTPGV